MIACLFPIQERFSATAQQLLSAYFRPVTIREL